MIKVHKRYSHLLASSLMSFFMGFLMSGIVTFINVGFPENFVSLWMNAFVKVVPIAFFVVLIVRPLVESLVKRLTE